MNLKSSSTSNINDGTSTNTKQNHMQLFVQSFMEYKNHRSEKLASELIRHLQLLSVTIDYSIFEPSTPYALDFFLNLHELLAKVEHHSAISWCCVNMLKTACKNPAARTALITNYQFIIPLCELLSDQLTTDKKMKLLLLMQELTCGINISWQISYLPHLMCTLSHWIITEETDIVIISLSIMVNLCYKNLPAIYTLCRCTDVKELMRHCLHNLKGPKIEMQVCKLLIILDYMDGTVPGPLVRKLVDVLFTTIFESFKANDSFYMRHSLEFFLDFRKKHADVDGILRSDECGLQSLLTINLNTNSQDDATPTQHSSDPDCIAILLHFYHIIATLHLPSLIPLYPHLLQLCLRWIHTDTVATHSLQLMRTIVQHSSCAQRLEGTTDAHMSQIDAVGALIVVSLPLVKMPLRNLECVETGEEYGRLVAAVQLFRALIGLEKYREEVVEVLHDVDFNKIFDGVLNGISENTCVKDTSSMLAVTVYVNFLAIINELSKYKKRWLKDIIALLKHKQIHSVLSQALYQGDEDTKMIVLSMASTPCFPCKLVARAMAEMQNVVPQIKANTDAEVAGKTYPVLSNNQSQRLDDLLDKIKANVSENGHLYAAAAEIIELYDYKIASLRESEEVAQTSLTSAANQCVQYQIRSAQLTAEVNRLQLQLISAEERHDSILLINEELKVANEEIAKRVEFEHRERIVLKEEYEIRVNEKMEEIQNIESKMEILENTFIYNKTTSKRKMDELIQDLKEKEASHEDAMKIVTSLTKDLQSEKTNTEKLLKRVRDLEIKFIDKSKAIEKAQRENSELHNRLKIILKVVTK